MLSNSPSSRVWIVGSVMASMAMVAIEATIVSTAMPQIVADLGGLNLYAWVFAAFLLHRLHSRWYSATLPMSTAVSR